ncbi:modification methylase [Candidatus Poribacteria bacterium]|nr:modification methylase [Candidatus Poribacteria bacterium]
MFGTLDTAARSGSERDQLFREVQSFPTFDAIGNGELFSLCLSNKTTALTHGMHRFPAKYIPQIPGWVMGQFAQKDDVVLDPFCGSGTTLVEGLLRSGKTIGLDCDPLACMISRAKTAAVNPARIRKLGLDLRQTWKSPATQLIPPMPDLTNFDHWFSRNTWGNLQSLFASIVALDATAEELNFLLCVFSSIIRRVSNADDQSQKTYVSGTLKKNPPEVEGLFYRVLEKALDGLEELALLRSPSAEAIAIQGDATDIQLPNQSVDLIITSPPYLDSVDYMYNFMLEYFWLGPMLGVQDRRTFNQMRRGVTGAKNPLSNSTPSLPKSLEDLISEVDMTPHRVAAIRAYCDNMARHFHSAAKTLKPGGFYFLVIGNSRTGKGVLPMHDSLTRLAADAGFIFEKAFGYRIRRHYMKFPRSGRGGIITMDWVIALKKTQKPAPYPARLPLPDFTLRHDEVAN